MAGYWLAQVNVGLARHEMDSIHMQGFVSRLEEIDSLADHAPGFVWRLQTEEGDSTSIRVFDDPLMLVNLSVWEDLAALRKFVFKSSHAELLKNRAEWFRKMDTSHLAMWWIPRGHTPSVEEAKEKLEYIRQHGPSQAAFNLARPFPSP
jgi:Domain of unknown function (DUF3291)